MDIQIANRQRRHPISLRTIRRRARIILGALGHPEGELSIVFVNDRQMAAMNREFLGREGPTNVIAFPMREGRFSDLSPNLLGDVVISADTAHREGLQAGRGFDARLTELLVHGVLHLCGYDHETHPADARRMGAKSRRLLKRIQEGTGPAPRRKIRRPIDFENGNRKTVKP